MSACRGVLLCVFPYNLNRTLSCPQLRNSSARTMVQVEDNRLNDIKVSSQADENLDCLSDRTCHPITVGTFTLSVDKPTTKEPLSENHIRTRIYLFYKYYHYSNRAVYWKGVINNGLQEEENGNSVSAIRKLNK